LAIFSETLSLTEMKNVRKLTTVLVICFLFGYDSHLQAQQSIKIEQSQILDLLKSLDEACLKKNAKSACTNFAQDAAITATFSQNGQAFTDKYDKIKYQENLERGFPTFDDYTSERTNTNIHIASDGKSATAKSALIEEFRSSGVKMKSTSEENYSFELVNGAILINSMSNVSVVQFASTTVLTTNNTLNEEAFLSPTERATFEHPKQFLYDVTEDPDDVFQAAMRLRVFGDDGISSLSFKIYAKKDENGELAGQKEVDAAVQKMGAGYAKGSVEKTNAVYHLVLKNGMGAYSVFTDADLVNVVKLPPGQFRHMTLGLIKIGEYGFIVRGYSNTKEGADYKAILGILESLKVEKN
jgi:hypothetical protein